MNPFRAGRTSFGALDKLFSVGESDSDKDKDKDKIDPDEWSHAHSRKLDNETINDKQKWDNEMPNYDTIIKLVFVEKNYIVNVLGLETLYLKQTHIQILIIIVVKVVNFA